MSSTATPTNTLTALDIKNLIIELELEGQWVSITEIRTYLPGGREDQDAALRAFNRLDGGVIVPESNQKALRQVDRDAALWIGGQHKHHAKYTA